MGVLFVCTPSGSVTRPFVFVTLGVVFAACGGGGHATVPQHGLAATPASPAALHAPRGRELQVQIPAAEWYSCFEDKCKCRGHFADCSQNHGKLTFIPQLPMEIRSLNFSYNSLETIPRDFFANVTDISSVDLSNNELKFIQSNAFNLVTNLSCLVLKYNSELTYGELDPVFSVRTLQELDVSGLNLGKLPAGFFQRYTFANLKNLNLFGNRLMSGNLTVFAKLENLVNLDLGYNDISSVVADTVMKLETINLEQNGLFSEFPKSCKDNSSLFPSLTALALRGNVISSIPGHICLPALRYLDLRQNDLSVILTDSFSTARFPKLEELHLDSMNGGVVRMEDYAFDNEALEMLSLANNHLSVNDRGAVKPDSFKGCGRLSELVMAGNVLAATSDSQIQQLFGVLPLLRELDLSSGLITNISNLTFANLPSLQQLSLSSNFLTSLPDGVVDMAENLTVLDLSHNRLRVVLETSFNATTRQRLRHLDLSGNRYLCSCQLMWFRQWFVTQPTLFNHSRYAYTCSHFLEDIPLDTFYKNKQACMLDSDGYIWLLVISMSFVVFSVTMITVFTIVRLLEQPLLVRAFGGGENGVRFGQNENFQYDVFVAYAEGDEDWVRGHLMPELEGRLGLRLCVHQRDFHPGRNILDNIEDCVESSKKVVMVFSTHFAASQWCQFELSLCQRHVMDNDDGLLVVCVEDVQPREWTPGMMAILRTTTYIRWLEAPRHRAGFWNSMATALADVIPAVRQPAA